MKIKISEQESYKIKTEEEYTPLEFVQLLERLVEISQILLVKEEDKAIENIKQKPKLSSNQEVHCMKCNSNILTKNGYSMEDGKKYQRYTCKSCSSKFMDSDKGFIFIGLRKRSKNLIKWNKDEVTRVLRIHYLGIKEDKEAVAQEKGVTWNHIMKAIHGLRRKYNIQPQEVGVGFSFPIKKERARR